LRDNTGPVTAITAVDKEGVEIRIQAKAVIIASGSYADNPSWIKKYNGFDLETDLFAVIPCDKTGEGIEMAWSVGAVEEGTGVLLFNIRMPPCTVGPDEHLLGADTLGQSRRREVLRRGDHPEHDSHGERLGAAAGEILLPNIR
jgi:hypothetical protein